MSVSERTREIGILKAVGWSQFRVLRMILSESLLLSLVGFGVGCLLGMGVIWLITSFSSVQGYISPSFSGDAFLIGLAVALLLGFLGGVFPAYRASRLSPTEALRRE
jgi:putative ABC transport system permease protein